jgi:hypothetical protein
MILIHSPANNISGGIAYRIPVRTENPLSALSRLTVILSLFSTQNQSVTRYACILILLDEWAEV